MADEIKATEPEPIATQTEKVSVEDLEAKNAALEAEKVKLVGERENYKVAYFKEKSKHSEPDGDESDDDRIRRITHETLADSRLAEIAREQQAIIDKALKENKELKLAINNKTDIPVSTGVHSEGIAVKDTLITPDLEAYFKSKNYTEKDRERYKKNLLRYAGR